MKKKLLASIILGFMFFTFYGTVQPAHAASSLYTWMPSRLYKTATGTSYSTTVYSGVQVINYGKSHSRYHVKVGTKTGYIKAYNLATAKIKKTDFFGSKVYKQAKIGAYIASLRAGKSVYLKSSSRINGMYLVHYIGTSYSGYVAANHFTAPSTKYTWTGSYLYTSSTGSTHRMTLNSGTSVQAFGSSNQRTLVKVDGTYGYIKNYNLVSTLIKKTIYTSTPLFSTATGTTPLTTLAVTKKVYVKETANNRYHVHVIGTSRNGWIVTSSCTPTTVSKDLVTTTKGVDVSHYQSLTQTSFNSLRSAGYSFVILKASEGTTYTDPTFYTYYKYAKNAGLSVHAYHVIGNSSTSSATPRAEAAHFASVLSQTKAETGYTFDGYAFEDVEATKSNGITTAWWENNAVSSISYFLNELTSSGQAKIGVYSNYSSWTSYLQNHTSTWPTATKIWLARYNETLGTNADIWQYTSTGTIDGFDTSGSLDIDIGYSI
ncbi:glycoside hydrolase family 25 protein [Sporolactobacillus spathodeae]|uniref:GH25 family lysozyme M1 (1,4-beta-N-acetylmuramidase) n=1 Tax=Sporolactobacillus spathodeae TaxID=1465502 RepID=A0ABS2Q9E0_9BACL|nr:GH25 family lysozyme M1 (1,4-beta-N-acetylmuramidase) [Sporolactobacillus spathodeae]